MEACLIALLKCKRNCALYPFLNCASFFTFHSTPIVLSSWTPAVPRPVMLCFRNEMCYLRDKFGVCDVFQQIMSYYHSLGLRVIVSLALVRFFLIGSVWLCEEEWTMHCSLYSSGLHTLPSLKPPRSPLLFWPKSTDTSWLLVPSSYLIWFSFLFHGMTIWNADCFSHFMNQNIWQQTNHSWGNSISLQSI